MVTEENYSVRIDRDNNRIHLKLWGEVIDRSKFASLPDHMKQACHEMQPGFTCLADFREVTFFALPDLATSTQQALLDSGVSKVASLWAQQLLAKLGIDKAAKTTGDEYASRRKVFTDLGEAEKWLDE